eukprot:TRINITY_DN1940_c0_g1_i8.p1 TRINITY_DN1940_c0_g1~~TRINITY_DN1940_c0_g1_i8.p1  ORF type:complete len:235 (-),score=24.81 TRINITY_DN1940_c0_g1_i8:73-777(-)
MCIRDSYHSFLRQLRLSDSELRNFGNQWLPEIVNIAYSFVMALVYFLFALPGLLLTYPIGLIIRRLSEKERKKALASSEVKITGKDVVASHKVVTSFIIFPPAFFLFFTIHHFFMKYILNDAQDKYVRYYDALFLVWWPFYLYTMLIAGDELKYHLQAIRAKLVLTLVVGNLSELKDLRQSLKDKVREFVDKYGAEVVENFNENRIISKQDIKQKNDYEIDHAFSTLKELEHYS